MTSIKIEISGLTPEENWQMEFSCKDGKGSWNVSAAQGVDLHYITIAGLLHTLLIPTIVRNQLQQILDDAQLVVGIRTPFNKG